MAVRDTILDPTGGGSYLYADASLYTYFLGGNTSGAPNILRWQGGKVHVPNPIDWRYFGKGNQPQNAMDLPVDHRINGNGPVIVDGRLVVMPGTMVSQPGVTYVGSGVWRCEMFTQSSGTISSVQEPEVYFGAESAVLTADWRMGERFRGATSLVNVDSTGSTTAGMKNSKGLWYFAVETSLVDGFTAAVLYIYTGSDSQRPDDYYGGIGCTIYVTNGASTRGSQRYSPFVVHRNSTAANDPSGTLLRGGFTIIGHAVAAVGSPPDANLTASRPISGVVYSGFTAIGNTCVWTGSFSSGSTIQVRLDEGFHVTNAKEGDKFPIRTAEGTSDGTELMSIEVRSRLEIDNGTGRAGLAHGVINIASDITAMSGVEEELVTGFVRKFVATATTDAGDVRGFTVRNSRNFALTDSEFHLFPTATHLGGYGTQVQRVRWVGGQNNYANPGDSQELVNLFNGDFDPSLTRVTVRDSEINRMGDVARGVAEPWACFTMKSGGISTGYPTGRPVAAGTMTLDRCLFLQDAGGAMVRFREQTGYALSLAQTITNCWDNYSGAVGPARLALGGSTIGTSYTYAGMLTGGTATGNVTDTYANILKRPDRPARFAGHSAGLGAVD